MSTILCQMIDFLAVGTLGCTLSIMVIVAFRAQSLLSFIPQKVSAVFYDPSILANTIATSRVCGLADITISMNVIRKSTEEQTRAGCTGLPGPPPEFWLPSS
ncbi:hypothetical protein Tco_0986279 [Tanacetum coccineum]